MVHTNYFLLYPHYSSCVHSQIFASQEAQRTKLTRWQNIKKLKCIAWFPPRSAWLHYEKSLETFNNQKSNKCIADHHHFPYLRVMPCMQNVVATPWGPWGPWGPWVPGSATTCAPRRPCPERRWNHCTGASCRAFPRLRGRPADGLAGDQWEECSLAEMEAMNIRTLNNCGTYIPLRCAKNFVYIYIYIHCI